jgi:hypothetical protein
MGKSVLALSQPSTKKSNVTGNLLIAATSGSALTLFQLKPGWLASTATVEGSACASSRFSAVSPRRAPAAAVSTVAVHTATSRASTTSDTQRRRTSRRSQVSTIRTPSPTPHSISRARGPWFPVKSWYQ